MLASFPQPESGRLDTLLSPLPPPGPVRAVYLLAVARTQVLVLPDGATGTEGFLLPRSEVGHDADSQVVLAELGVSVLGPAWRYGGPPVQVGYLRNVRGERVGGADSELVVRWRWPGLVAPPQPTGGASWVDVGQAAALLPVVVAPLVRPS